MTLLLRDGFVTDEFIDLARAHDRSPPKTSTASIGLKAELAQANHGRACRSLYDIA